MADIADGRVRRSVDLLQSFTQHLGEGLVATDGVVYSPVATFGTTAVEVLNQLIDPGFDLSLKELEVSLVQKFTEKTGGTTAGSIAYTWDARSEWYDPVGTIRTSAYVNLVGTLTKGVASGASSEDTLEGYVPVGSVPNAPVRIRLLARSLYASAFTGQVKNTSYVRMVGIVIPGA